MHSHSILLLTKSFGNWSAGTAFHPASDEKRTGFSGDPEIDCTSVYPLQGKYVRVWIPERFLVEKRHRVKDWSAGETADEQEVTDES